jgi:hypothetical protein
VSIKEQARLTDQSGEVIQLREEVDRLKKVLATSEAHIKILNEDIETEVQARVRDQESKVREQVKGIQSKHREDAARTEDQWQ